MVSRCDAEEKEIFKVPEKRDQGWSGAPEEVSHVREEVLKNEVLNTREDSTHGHHQMVDTEIRLILFFATKDGSSIQPVKTRLGADCGSDHELLIAKFRLTLKKVGKTTRPYKVKVKVKLLSRVRLFATPWTVAHQAPLSIVYQALCLSDLVP